MSATKHTVHRFMLMTKDGMFFLNRFGTELIDNQLRMATYPTRQMAETVRDHRAPHLGLVVREVELSVRFVD